MILMKNDLTVKLVCIEHEKQIVALLILRANAKHVFQKAKKPKKFIYKINKSIQLLKTYIRFNFSNQKVKR